MRWTISSWLIAPLFWIGDCCWPTNYKHRRLWQLKSNIHFGDLHHGLTSVWSLSSGYHTNNWWYVWIVVISLRQLRLIYDILWTLTNTLNNIMGATCAAEIAFSSGTAEFIPVCIGSVSHLYIFVFVNIGWLSLSLSVHVFVFVVCL